MIPEGYVATSFQDMFDRFKDLVNMFFPKIALTYVKMEKL